MDRTELLERMRESARRYHEANSGTAMAACAVDLLHLFERLDAKGEPFLGDGRLIPTALGIEAVAEDGSHMHICYSNEIGQLIAHLQDLALRR